MHLVASAPATIRDHSTRVDLAVVNKDDQQLGLIDLLAGVQTRVVPLSAFTGHEVAVRSDGSIAYAPIYSDVGVGAAGFDGRSIDVVDLRSGMLIRTHDLGDAVRPHCAVIDGDGLLYVTAELSELVLVLDERTLEIIATIPTGAAQSHMIALSGDGRVACTSNVEPGSVSVIDVASRTLRGVVPVSPRVNRIALSHDGRRAYTADQTRPRIAVVDTETLTVAEWIALPSIGFGSALAPDGRLVIALRAADAVAIIDPEHPDDLRIVPVPAGPQIIVLDELGERAYSACHVAQVVVEVDLASAEVTKVIPTGRNPDGLCWVGRSFTD